jgi:ketosteroid isomerase-like protein
MGRRTSVRRRAAPGHRQRVAADDSHRDTGRAMSQENVEVVRRMLERWNAGDLPGMLQCWDQDATWVSEPFRALEGGPRTYHGHGGLRRFAAEVLEGFADMGRIGRTRFREVGDAVLVLGDYLAKPNAGGPEVSTPWAWLFEVRDKKIARGRDFLEQREALEAVGLSE